MDSGIARHKMVSNFRSTHKNLPLYSSEYTDMQGSFIFGGTFGNGDQSILLFLSFNKYNPTLRRLQYVGIPPSPVDPIVERMNENLILIISGEVTQRKAKIYRIKQREFVSINKTNSNPFYGGLGSTITKYENEYYLFFGLGPNGYVGNISSLQIEEKVVENDHRKKKQKTFEL